MGRKRPCKAVGARVGKRQQAGRIRASLSNLGDRWVASRPCRNALEILPLMLARKRKVGGLPHPSPRTAPSCPWPRASSERTRCNSSGTPEKNIQMLPSPAPGVPVQIWGKELGFGKGDPGSLKPYTQPRAATPSCKNRRHTHSCVCE